ncbi:MAG: hypothetical protein RL223_2212 [Pseudomonadota bacterium]|jgi:nitrite reductase/ring-hydroxylating ferredoxin subunit
MTPDDELRWLTLCPLTDWPDRSARGFDPLHSGCDALFIVRIGVALHAWHNACPHVAGAPMAWRKDAYLSADGRHITCAAHGAQFDIATGVCILGPCLGQALSPAKVRVHANGDVQWRPAAP